VFVQTAAWLAALFIVQFAITSFFSGLSAPLFFAHLTGAVPDLPAAWNVLRRRGFDLLSFSAAYVGLGLWRQPRLRQPVSPAALTLAWAQAAYLVPPVIAIENLSLKDALHRTAQIVADRLLRMGSGLIGVRAYNQALSGLLALLGLGLGLAVAAGLRASPARAVTAFNLELYTGAALFSLCGLLAVVLSAFTSTAYHTSLYVWALSVERARQAGGQQNVTAPAYLSTVLSRSRLTPRVHPAELPPTQ